MYVLYTHLLTFNMVVNKSHFRKGCRLAFTCTHMYIYSGWLFLNLIEATHCCITPWTTRLTLWFVSRISTVVLFLTLFHCYLYVSFVSFYFLLRLIVSFANRGHTRTFETFRTEWCRDTSCFQMLTIRITFVRSSICQLFMFATTLPQPININTVCPFACSTFTRMMF